MSRRFQFSLMAIFKATTWVDMLAGFCKAFAGPVETAILFTVAFLVVVPACFRE